MKVYIVYEVDGDCMYPCKGFLDMEKAKTFGHEMMLESDHLWDQFKIIEMEVVE